MSVIMPAFNSEKYIAESIESVLRQIDVDLELIVVNDGSTDSTPEILASFQIDSRVRVLTHSTNLGPAIARNRAIEEAKGRFIAFLDADDVWTDDKLSRQVEQMLENQWAFSYTEYELIDSNGERIGGSGKLADSANYSSLLKGCIIQNSTVIYDIELLGRRFYCPNIPKRQDFGLFLEILRTGVSAHRALPNEASCSYRISADGISNKKSKNIPHQWQLYHNVEGFGIAKSLYYMAHWFIYAALKSKRRLKQ